MPMKHVKVLSKPSVAEETAWVELKNLVSLFGVIPVNPNAGPRPNQADWIWTQWNNYLSK